MKTDTTMFEESIKEESVLHEISICPLEDCFQECSSKEDYTLHLYQEHYKDVVYYDLKDELEIEVDSSRWPVCKKDSEQWGRSYTELVKHIAVDHEYVMKYLKKDLHIDPELPSDIKNEHDSPLLFDNTISLLETDSDPE